MVSTDTTIISKLNADWGWVISHLILLLVVACLVWGGIYGVESIVQKHDAAVEAKYSAILQAQSATTNALETKLSADEASWSQAISQLTAQNQQLATQSAARDQQLSILLGKINTYTPIQVVADLQPKLRTGTATVSGTGVLLDGPASRDVDEQITEGINAKKDLVDAQTQLANETTIANDTADDAKETHAALASEQTKNADQVKACTAEVNNVKSQARKGKMKAFFLGVVVGYIGRILTIK